MFVFEDSDGDGSSEGETGPVASSASGTNNYEQATVADLEPGSKYVIRVVNYAAAEPYDGAITFAGPEPYVSAERERWTVVAKNRKGAVVSRRKLYIDRGQVKELNLTGQRRGKASASS